MPMSVCPAAVVAAPLEEVWALLMQPELYGQWWDIHTERVTLPGPATPGQVVAGWSKALGRKWAVSMTIEMVDAQKHQMRVATKLPLGIGVQNRIVCAKVDATSCRVQYG